MILERDVLISLLKLTRAREAQVEDISLDAKAPVYAVNRVIKKNSEIDLITLKRKIVTMNGTQRIKAAIRAVELGADLEHVSKLLEWNEFEDITALAFENSRFSTKKHFRFKNLRRLWEIDVLALKDPIIVCVDCKHWLKGWKRSSIIKVVEDQVNRTRELAEASPLLQERIGIVRWKEATFVPVILSLVTSDFKFYKDVPIVPILQLRDFLAEVPAYADSLLHFSKKFS